MTLLRGKPREPGAEPPNEPSIRYEDDSYGWALQQAGFLRGDNVMERELLWPETRAVG